MNGEEINTLPGGAPEEEKKPLIARWREDGLLSRRMIALLIVFAFSLAVYLTARLCTPFAEFWTRYPAQAGRFITAKAMGWFPFSFAECVIISLPVLLIAYITAAIVSGRRDSSNRRFYRLLKPLISLLLVIGILFFAGFGTGYNRNPLEKNLGIERSAVSAFELYETAQKVINEMDNVLPNVSFDSTGASVMPYGFSELTEKVNSAFDGYAAGVDYISHFSSKPKAIALSEPMTYTHISGVYTYMTGEANINTNYPDFIRPFTMAHEMAHQRGISREEEANFVAFLVCASSDDNYVRYSAYMNMLNYLRSALYTAVRGTEDENLFRELNSITPKKCIGELSAYSKFFDKYRESTASTVSGKVNDTFLKSQGQKSGISSYGLVVDLAVAYYKSIG